MTYNVFLMKKMRPNPITCAALRGKANVVRFPYTVHIHFWVWVPSASHGLPISHNLVCLCKITCASGKPIDCYDITPDNMPKYGARPTHHYDITPDNMPKYGDKPTHYMELSPHIATSTNMPKYGTLPQRLTGNKGYYYHNNTNKYSCKQR